MVVNVAQDLYKDKETLESLINLMWCTCDAILEVYQSDTFYVELKGNNSPITQADLSAHSVLVNGLSNITPEIPVVSEEDPSSLDIPRKHKIYWLIDPLDGTKEFIKRNGEFTCNLALIDNHQTILGFVGVPADGLLYYGGKTLGANRIEKSGISRSICCSTPGPVLKVVASKSHISPDTLDYLDTLNQQYELISIGSSLKFLLLAEGQADLYPRMGHTCEWDTSAAHAVLEGAGGRVRSCNGTDLVYGKSEILNPWFIASTCNANSI
jgi:3'(2'), 5'-bisphosphate nucleotidase